MQHQLVESHQGIENSVDELNRLCVDIAKHLKVQTTPTYSTMTLPSKARQRRAVNSEDRAKRNSMPEVPLTPREKTILRETSLGAFDNPLALEKGDSPLSPSQPIQSRSSSVETPPELPIKKSLMSRSEIMNNSVDSLDGGHYSPITDSSSSSRPHSAFFPNVDSYNNIVNRHNMMYVRSDRSGGSGGQLFSSHDSLDGPVGKRSSIVSSSSASSASYSAQLRLMSDGGRVFLTHAEDLSPIQPISGLTSAGSVSGHNLDTSDLSNQIDQLKMGFMKGSASHHSKPRCRLSSDYDNVSVGSYDSPTPPAANVMSTSEVWQTESSRSFMHRSFDGLTTTNHWHQKQVLGICSS
ncbi:hypothetical protein EB796_015493 [Bugula neritina]|uniref:Uncharacterized protein n=1 Tax=Bugula neritina TaxID=10212 RepID=A0A7J7JKQ7_BUGNE|nr:hypothetical protein EB796_015493 [Bugula neritina]